MSSRLEDKQAARDSRLAAEERARAGAARARRLRMLGIALAAAAAIVVVAILVGQGGSDSSNAPPATKKESSALFAGIPQQGVTLGRAGAPVTIQEFADLQCPYCRQFALGGLPTLVREYVRTGKVRLVFHNVAFLGADSLTARKVAMGAALQNKLWQFIDRFYVNQGEENSGYVTHGFLEKVGGQVHGLDLGKAVAAGTSPAAARLVRDAEREYRRVGQPGTPAFLIGRTGAPGKPITLGFDGSSVVRAVDAALPKGV